MRLSYSQINSYGMCPEQYRLEKIKKIPSRPTWGAVGGGAFHTLTEVQDWRRQEMDPPSEINHIFTFDDALDYEIDERLRQSPDFKKSDWYIGGRASKEFPNKEDEGWWRKQGPSMAARWENFQKMVPWDIYHDEQGPSIEVGFEMLVGDDTVAGFVDRVFQSRDTGALIAVDIKSNARTPKSHRQLTFYKKGLETAYPDAYRITYGAFWMGRTGSATELVVLQSDGRLDYLVQSLHKARDENIFIANPSDLCVACGVRDYCYEMSTKPVPVDILPWSP